MSTIATRRRGVDPHPAIARRRNAVRRAHRRRMVATGAVGVVCAAFGYWLATGPVLTVSGVTLHDYERSDAAQLEQVLSQAAERGGSLLAPPVGAIRRAALTSPWVKDVVVRRDWPMGLSVEVIPATPAVVARTASGSAVLISEDGRVMGPAPADAALGTIALPRTFTATAGAAVPPPTRAVVRFMDALDPELAARVTTIGVRGGIVVGQLRDGPQLRLGTPDHMVDKATAVVSVVAQVSADDLRAAPYLDASVPSRPVLGAAGIDNPIVRHRPDATPRATPTADGAPAGTAASTPSPGMTSTSTQP